MNIVDLAIKSIVVTLLGLVVLLLARRGSAATRHFALALSLFSLCALPFVAPLVPNWSVPFLKVTVPSRMLPSVDFQKIRPTLQSPDPSAAVTVAREVAVPMHIDRDTALLLIWASIATLFGLRLFTRYNRLRRLERSLPMFAQPELQALVADHCRRHQRHFLLLEGESNEPPMTWGHGRPVLLLPSAARDWPQDRLRSVMLHEMAHVERGDWIVSLASEIVCALFWFNPLVWVIRQQLEIESELAADERVLSSGVAPTQYATHLVELLRDLNRFPRAADAAVGMTRPSRLDGRIKAILQANLASRPTRGAAHLGFIAAVATIVVLVGAAGPTLIHEHAPTDAIDRATPSPLIEVTSRPLPPTPNRDHARDLALAEPGPSESMEVTRDRSESVLADARPPVPPPAPKTPNLRSLRQTHLPPIAPETTPTPEAHGSLAPCPDLNVPTSVESIASSPARNSDEADVAELGFDPKELRAQLKRASSEVKLSLEEARREASKSGVKLSVDSMNVVARLDVAGIIGGALQAAGEGLKSVKLTTHQREQIASQIRESIRQATEAKSLTNSDSND